MKCRIAILNKRPRIVKKGDHKVKFILSSGATFNVILTSLKTTTNGGKVTGLEWKGLGIVTVDPVEIQAILVLRYY